MDSPVCDPAHETPPHVCDHHKSRDPLLGVSRETPARMASIAVSHNQPEPGAKLGSAIPSRHASQRSHQLHPSDSPTESLGCSLQNKCGGPTAWFCARPHRLQFTLTCTVNVAKLSAGVCLLFLP